MTLPIDFDETTRLREENKELREALEKLIHKSDSDDMFILGFPDPETEPAKALLARIKAALTENGQGTLPPVSLTRP